MPFQLRRFRPILMAMLVGGYALVPTGGPGLRLVEATERPRAFFERYCFECHSGEGAEGELRLDGLVESENLADERDRWTKVYEHLRGRLMPPPEADQPSDDEVRLVTDWLSGEFTSMSGSGGDPTWPTIRRLNREEYNNTIRDLLYVDLRPADRFPADDVGNGFDNMGEVLSLSPLLMEKVLAAAEELAVHAIHIPVAIRSIDLRLQAQSFEEKPEGGEIDGGGWMLTSEGSIVTSFEVPENGEYRVQIKAWGDQAGDEPPRLSVRVGRNELKTFDVTALADSPQTYEYQTRYRAGRRRLSLDYVNDYYNPSDPDPANRDRNLAIVDVAIRGPMDARAAELPESHKRIVFRQPEGGNQEECAREILSRFVGRAYRRPATEAELDRLVALAGTAWNRGEPFEGGIRLAIQAVLSSPSFLFRVEAPVESAEAKNLIDDYALATRLSYFLWSTMPDEELFEEAARGTLHEPVRLSAQVERMLADGKSSAFVKNFADQWLTLRNLATFRPDPARFPRFGESLRAAMLTETEMTFEHVLQEGRSIEEFLDSDYTFLNERLARHYGIAGVEGDEFRKVSLAGSPRGGLLTQGSILTVTSNPTRTSPVKRGKWVLEQIMGTPPPPPPPGAGDLTEGEQAELTGSLRQRMEQHRAKESCAVCHRSMDPLGFGLENFDAVGAWREQDGSFPIDASGVLPDGQTFSGPEELRAILLSRKGLFTRALAEKMLAYALGRGLVPADREAVDQIAGATASDGYKLKRMVEEVVKSEPFQMRKNPGEMP